MKTLRDIHMEADFFLLVSSVNAKAGRLVRDKKSFPKASLTVGKSADFVRAL